ncbi:MAG: ornithine cyclodeaminase family protein [Fibrobacterota bacterium]
MSKSVKALRKTHHKKSTSRKKKSQLLAGVQYPNSEKAPVTSPSITRGKEILYLTKADIESLGYEPGDLLELVRLALSEHGRKRYEMPAKIGLHPIQDTLMHAMPAFVPHAGACGIKWAYCFPENYKYGLSQTSGLLMLNDIQTGWPIAIMDAIWITAKRTPLVTALAVEKLARKNSAEVGILGCGVQGREHIPALSLVMPSLKKVKVLDKFPESAKRLVKDCAGKYPFEIVVANDVEDLVRNSDVVVTATAILQTPNPLVKDGWIKKGAFLAPIDFDSVFEWKTMKRADKFLVDSLDEMEYFMQVGYLAHGLPKLHAELGEVVAGLKPGRENDDELIMDMNIGMGVEDVVLAQDILKRALVRGVGKRLPL